MDDAGSTHKRRLKEVFQTVGLPKYTYIKPRHFGEIRSDIEQSGKHLLIEGPSGIGKSCVAYKVFEELSWESGRNYAAKSCREGDAFRYINEFLDKAMQGDTGLVRVLLADDFHILTESERSEIGSRLKMLSDRTFEQAETSKLILVGIPAAGASLLSNSKDLGPRLGSYRIQRAEDREIDKLIDEGEAELSVLFENRDVILSECNGNFWLAQYICNKICASSDVHEAQDEVRILSFDLAYVRQRLMAELSNNFMSVATTFSKGKKWRPGGNKPYLEVLLAIAKLPELVIPFDNVLGIVGERRRPGIRAIRPRIKEVLHNPAKNIDLRKQIAFEENSFSIEDPLFRYFLSNLDEEALYGELGTRKDVVESTKTYSYDIGFSFAGEARTLVESVNGLLKAEDILTFYDFDQQAFLLAENLEEVLGRIYAESCKYYLVFLDENYLNKVWTKFERDVLTNSARAKHIVPVLLDPQAKGKVVGVPSTIGMVDLSVEWANVKLAGGVSDDVKVRVQEKLVRPLSEKLNEVFTSV